MQMNGRGQGAALALRTVPHLAAGPGWVSIYGRA